VARVGEPGEGTGVAAGVGEIESTTTAAVGVVEDSEEAAGGPAARNVLFWSTSL
jgi:hypothetical protein